MIALEMTERRHHKNDRLQGLTKKGVRAKEQNLKARPCHTRQHAQKRPLSRGQNLSAVFHGNDAKVAKKL